MRHLLFLLLLAGLLAAPAAKTQSTAVPQIFFLKDSLSTASSDTARAYLLIKIAIAYCNNRRLVQHWVDSAVKYNELAFDFCQKKRFNWLSDHARSIEPYFYLASGQHGKAEVIMGGLPDSVTVRIWWRFGQFYSGAGYGYSLNMDSTLYCYQKALALSGRINNPFFLYESYRQLAYYYCRKEDFGEAQKFAEKVTNLRKNNPESLATMWYNMGIAVFLVDKNFAFKRYCYERSLAYAKVLDSATTSTIKELAGRTLMSMSDLYDYTGNDSMAVVCLMQALDKLKAVKDKLIYSLYLRLHDKYYYKGNLDKALYYAVEALKGAEADGRKNLHQYYLYIGNDCFEMGQVAKSIEYYGKGLASARSSDKIVSGVLIKRMAKSMVALGRASEALAFVQEAVEMYRLPAAVDSMLKEEALAICYNGLGQYDLAEKYYGRMKAYMPRVASLQAAIYPLVLGKFYYERGQYDKAIPYIEQCLQMPTSWLPRFAIADMHLMLYRIDSTRNQHQLAMDHYLRYRAINDSIFTTKQKQQLEELRLQFDLEKKDLELQRRITDINILTKEKLLQEALADQTRKDALLKQQSIDLLTQQAEMQDLIYDKQELTLQQQKKEIMLQQDNIILLHNRELLQIEKLKHANFIKQMTIAGVVLLSIIIVLLYSRYRTRKRTSQQFSEKNEKLQQLLDEKQLLLKEVHHRVKNNLQVVLSLLQSQSAFLQDEALAAVNDSQHRVQAMSLLHQKLYQSDNVAAIDMGIYIPELVSYLKDSFTAARHIWFMLEITPVTLDVKQAIPLGLIINEAVTNAYKHAFTGRPNGQVSIILKHFNEQEMVLIVKDNGIGIPDNSMNARKGSLGMSLIKGLCGDFYARYIIQRDQGTSIQVIFPA